MTIKRFFQIDTKLLSDEVCLWSNLGYWNGAFSTDVSVDFVRACEALARRLALFAELESGQEILDLCVGQGESVRYILEHFPSANVTAVEFRESALESLIKQSIFGLKGVYNLKVEDPKLLQILSKAQFDRVICLDAMYHLYPLDSLWKLCSQVLKPGGKVAACSLFSKGPKDFPKLKTWLKLAAIKSVPSESDLNENLEKFGFSDLNLQWITEEVLLGFSKFVAKRSNQLRESQKYSLGWLKISATAKLAEKILQDGSIGYALMVARKSADR